MRISAAKDLRLLNQKFRQAKTFFAAVHAHKRYGAANDVHLCGDSPWVDSWAAQLA